LNRTKSGDIPKNFDEKQLGEWIQEAARKGPRLMTTSYVERAKPVVVTVTGAAGSIAYNLIPRILNGELLGPNQPVILKLLELPDALGALGGVAKEIEDMAFPLLDKLVITSNEEEAFDDCHFAILVGAKPRGKGMERKDLLQANAKVFASQGKAIQKCANPEVHVVVVGNPANTNALIVAQNASEIPQERITALTRLDHDRGLTQIAQKVGCSIADVHRFCIWGNHSATQYPDMSHVVIGEGKGTWARGIINDDKWCDNQFVDRVAKRGAEIIEVMGKSSALSAADATVKHMRDWVSGTTEWTSMAVPSDGNPYGIPAGVWCSFPILCNGGGQWSIVRGLPVSEYAAKRINASVAELLEERAAVESLFPKPKSHFVEWDPQLLYDQKFVVYNTAPSKRTVPAIDMDVQ